MLLAATIGCYGRETKAPPDASDVSLARRVDAVLIAKYMYDPDSAAALITDPNAVAELVDLVADNPHRVQHACGYHWLIAFRDPSGHVATYVHNQDCEEYERENRRVHSVLRKYFQQIKQRPTHSLFNVSVPASLAPEDIVAKSATSAEQIFFLNGADARLPRLRIEVSAVSAIPEDRREWDRATEANLRAATTNLTNVIATIRRAAPMIKHSRLDNRKSSFGGGQIEHSVESTVYFPYGFLISDDIVPQDVTVIEKAHPVDYTVQVVAAIRSPEAVGRLLAQRLGVPVRVAAYPDAPAQ